MSSPSADEAGSAARLRLVLVVATGLVAVIAFLLLRPSNEPNTTTTTASSATTSSPAAAATASSATASAAVTPGATSGRATGGDALPAPTVTATPQTGAVVFTWSQPSPSSGETYFAQVGNTGAEAEIADPVTLSTPTYRVTVASGAAVCLIATVVRGDQTSPASAPVCAPAS